MKPNELRIGNLFTPNTYANGLILPLTGQYLKVGSVDKFGQVTVIEPEKEDYPIYQYGEYSAIPLTPEWLARFGFRPFAKDYSKNGIVIHTRKRGFVLNSKTPVISSVHQLQNLFFCLRGEELTLNPSDNA